MRSVLHARLIAVVLSILFSTPLVAQETSKRDLTVITQSQTASFLAKFDGAGGTTDSVLYENGGFIGLGTTTPANAFHIRIANGTTTVPLKLETFDPDSITGISLKNDARNWHVRVDGTDGDKFKIYDANASVYRLSIDTNGRIGVGTSDPKAALHLYSPATSDVVAGFGPDPGGLTDTAFNVGYAGNSYGRGAGFLNVRPDPLATAPNPSLRFATANVERMIITNAGRVGIGTTNPEVRLQVFENADANTVAEVWNDNAGLNAAGAFRTRSNTAQTSYVSHGSGRTLSRYGLTLAGWSEILTWQGNGLVIGTNMSAPVVLGTSNVEQVRITPAGNVGIGTTSPTAKLHVNGDIVASGSITGASTLNATSATLQTLNVSNVDLMRVGGPNSNAMYGWGMDTVRDLAPAGRSPYVLQHHTGLNFAAHSVYGGIRFFNQAYPSVYNSQLVMSLTSGRVGVGTADPQQNPHVVGNALVTGNIVANGSITGATVIGAVYQDVAEWVPATVDMPPGTVVVLNREKNNEVMPSSRSYDTTVAGVVSAQPGLILGVSGESKEQIATTGRVKVRVDATRAPIRVGDLLVTSDASGMAMRSEAIDLGVVAIHRPGSIIGKALEPLNGGTGEILVLLSLQ